MAWRKRLAVVAAVMLAGGQAMVASVDAGQKASAFIKATWDSSVLYSRLAISPGVVDGKNYRKAFSSEIEVPAGNRLVDVYINARFGFNEIFYKGRVPFRAKLAPGRRYETRGRIAGRNVDVWIADAATNKLASKVLSINVERCYFRWTCPQARFEIKSSL